MKNEKVWISVLGFVSLLMLAYCAYAYIFLQTKLTMELSVLPENVSNVGNLIIPALGIVAIYHIFLLVRGLKIVSGRFVDSIYIALIVLSGITLFSDLTLLSDIGKEYLLWDVTDQWLILYGFLALHVLVVIWGLLSLKNSRRSALSRNEKLFITMHQIGLFSGILGLCGVIAANTQLIAPARFATSLMVLLSGLALFPLILFVFYWITKLKGIPFSEWLDEKQLNDTAAGTLLSLVISIPIYLVVCVLDLFQRTINVSSCVLGIFFVQLIVVSFVLITRNREHFKKGEGDRRTY